jgi:hypothetical protein
MKAADYVQKYEAGLYSANAAAVLATANTIIKDLVNELQSLIKEKHIQHDHAVFGAVKEVNTRYNAMINQFIQKHGDCPLKRDGFKSDLEVKLGMKI